MNGALYLAWYAVRTTLPTTAAINATMTRTYVRAAGSPYIMPELAVRSVTNYELREIC